MSWAPNWPSMKWPPCQAQTDPIKSAGLRASAPLVRYESGTWPRLMPNRCRATSCVNRVFALRGA